MTDKQLNSTFFDDAIVTRAGESLIDTVRKERDATRSKSGVHESNQQSPVEERRVCKCQTHPASYACSCWDVGMNSLIEM